MTPTPQASIHECARRGLAKELAILLAEGADPNDPAHHIWTPFLIAARHGHVDCLRLLIAAGVDIDQRFQGVFFPQHTGLMIALDSNNAQAARLLIDSGADTSYTTKNGQSALSIAEARHLANPTLPTPPEIQDIIDAMRARHFSLFERDLMVSKTSFNTSQAPRRI